MRAANRVEIQRPYLRMIQLYLVASFVLGGLAFLTEKPARCERTEERVILTTDLNAPPATQLKLRLILPHHECAFKKREVTPTPDTLRECEHDEF